MIEQKVRITMHIPTSKLGVVLLYLFYKVPLPRFIRKRIWSYLVRIE